ncbi:tRNA sulfurtransferase [Hafnia alvei]|uniref:tRNA sulfurtransferase n=1 Tax=Hafnia alvei TaxID=569 RepID=A0A377PNI8_HAFAL|nr:tRNA sulfurtransferase [Hafnia alvei]
MLNVVVSMIFTSIEVERYVGGGLNQHIESAKVKLSHPQVTVHLEIEDDRLLLIKAAMKA